MDRRKFLTAAAVIPAAAMFGGSRAQAADHLKWAVFTPDHEVTFRTVMKPFAAAVEKETDGAVVFDMFPNGALGRSPGQQAQMVINGVADVAWVIPSYSPGRFPDTEVLELPGVFNDVKEASLVASRLAGGDVLPDYGDYYVIGLWGTAPYSIHTNFPVNSIADLKGKTIRASSKTDSAALRAFGAVPVGMPVTEIPEAISRGTISGTTMHMSPFFDFGINRVTNNHFFIRLGIVPVSILMSKKKFDALPEAGRAAIKKHAGETLTRVWIDSITAFNQEIFLKLKDDPKHHVVMPSQADLAGAEKLLTPVRDEWVKASPRHKELKNALDAELAKVRSEGKG
ncbi:MAG: TRAP transporter substrate-binding protein [Pseudolabrys sp.]|nr:TRAP transporter substrate-binding protein [Pseudolabrys sp.]